MQIRNRLTLQFTLLAGLIIIGLLFSLYAITVIITQNEFYDRLKERDEVAANIFLERDELNKSLYEAFEKKYLRSLPHEVIQIFDESNEKKFIENNPDSYFPIERIEQVRKSKNITYMDGDAQVVGSYHHDNEGDFVIFVSAVDVYGRAHLYDLRMLLVVTSVISLIVLFFAGRYFSKNALLPISTMVHRVQQISASNLHLRVEAGKNKDEINEMAETFNGMLDQIENAFISQ